MTKDPAQFSETTGYAAIPIPTNGLVAAHSAAADLGAHYILLDDAELTPTAATVQSTLHPTQIDHVPGTTTYVLTTTAAQP